MLSREEEILTLIAEGFTVKEIIEKTGYSDFVIRKTAKDNNVKIKSRKTSVDSNIVSKIKELHSEGKTNKEIAVLLNMSPTTVRKYTYNMGLDTNSVKTKSITKKQLDLTERQKNIIYGTLLGDANIGINTKNARLAFTHGGNQQEYFDYKCSLFKDILGKINKSDRYDKRTDKWYHRYAVRLLAHPYFTELYNQLYVNGVKTVTQEWCDKLTAESIAFWFMDDGCNSGTLATNSFSKEECELLQQTLLKKFNIETTIHNQKNKSGVQYLLYIRAKSRKTFYDLIIPYIIPSMEYKLEGWNKLEPKTE